MYILKKFYTNYLRLRGFGYTFLTDNRLRELRQRGWIVNTEDKPTIWKKTPELDTKAENFRS